MSSLWGQVEPTLLKQLERAVLTTHRSQELLSQERSLALDRQLQHLLMA